MKKESIIAIFLGISLGTAIALTMVAATKNNQKNNSKLPVTPTIQIELENDKKTTSFDVSAPQSGEIVSDEKITITGKSPKNSIVVVQSAIGEQINKTENETFSINTPLKPGENNIHLVSYFDGEAHEKNITIYRLSKTQ